ARGAAASRLVVLETELAGSSRPAVGSYLQRWLDAARAQLMLATGRVGELHQLMRKRGAQGAVLAAHRALGDLLQGDAQAAALLSGRVLSDDSLPPRLRVQLLCIAAVAALRLERPESASPLLSA